MRRRLFNLASALSLLLCLAAIVLWVVIYSADGRAVIWGGPTFGGGPGRWRREHRQKRGQCARCGYDLRANTGRCPECGLAIPQKAEARA